MKHFTCFTHSRRYRWLAGCLCGLSVWAAGLHSTSAHEVARPEASSARVAAQAQSFTLRNGMTLVVQPDRRAPTAVHMLWVRVGSVDETDGSSGIAHVLEHMMFKGSKQLAEGEFSRRVAALGGRENAFTSMDATVYHQQIPAHRLPEVMRLEAERFGHNRWPDGAFRREIEVIKEERRLRIEESPQAQFFEAFMANALHVHPYRRPIIGWMDDLNALTPAEVRAFRQRWYVPANAAVVVVGDVDVAQVRRWAEQYYGALPAQPLAVHQSRTEPEQRGGRRFQYVGRTQQPMVLLGYRAPGLLQPAAADALSQDALALMLLAGVLDGHTAARLERGLVQPRLADSVSASFNPSGRGPAFFTLTATPAQGVGLEQVEAALKAEVQRIATEGVSEAELQRVKTQWRAAEVFKRDSLFVQARELGQSWLLGWPLDASEVLQQRLQAVRAEQVQAVAARWFQDRSLTVGTLVPEVAP